MARSTATAGGYAEEITVVTGWEKAINWHAVIAGTITALTMQILISMLGIGIGFGIVEGADPAMAEEAATAAAVWWAASGILSAFAGGLVAGAFSPPIRSVGIVHGLTAWALSTLIVLFVLGSVAGVALDQVMTGLGTGAVEPPPPGAMPAQAADPDVVAVTAFYGFVSLVVGAVLAAVGACIGTSKSIQGTTDEM